MFRNYLKITWKVLKRKKIYTFVTLAGIIIPVTFIVLITSFLTHINNYNSPKSKFRNAIFLDNMKMRMVKEDGSVLGGNNNPPTYSFLRDYVKTLKSPQAVSIISYDPFFNGLEIIYLNNKHNEVNIKYTDAGLWEIADFNFIQGRPFNKSEFDQGDRIVVIDEKTSISLFGTTELIGKTLTIRNENYKVCGVVEDVDVTMFRIAANIYIPYSCKADYFSKSRYANFSKAIVYASNKKDFEQIEEEFQQKLKTVSAQHMGNFNKLEASFAQENYFSCIKALSISFFKYYGDIEKPFYIIICALFFFFILLPAVNLVNINTNRVYERLSEIGVRKTFGATVVKLIQQFLFENIIIIFLGGLLSILISSIAIFGINKSDILSGVSLSINLKALFISLLLIFLLGILSGLLPSIVMARAKIIKSLSQSETN